MKSPTSPPALTVFFDGLCPLCSREIEHYRRQPGAESISFVDITASSFDPVQAGVNPRRVHEVLHVRDAQGRISTGVDAFVEIWRVLPRYEWAARWAGRAPIKAVLSAGYAVFAKLRPFLPRRARGEDCEASPYCKRK